MSQKSIALRCAIAALTAWVATSNAVADEAARSYRIAQQPLDQALREFALTSNVDLLFSPDLVSGKYSPILDGKFTVDEGLRVLLHGSGLAFSVSGAQVVIAKEKAQAQRTTSSITTPSSLIRVAHTAELATEESSNADGKGDDGAARRVQLEEVIVTGSHIRGVQNMSSPVLQFTRDEIEKTGFATTEQLVQSLPQNLSNISDTTFGTATGGPGTATTYNGSGVNLRGLGSDATLVLLNGRRLASAGNGSLVDLSLIPLSAIERMDVLTDGASAIYGSDAVGGVVNLVLREDFEGAETRARYGSVTQGEHDELQLGQMYGHAWNSGHALVSYEYFKRTPLDAADREFFDLTAYPSMQLIPAQKRHGVLAFGEQRIGERAELAAELFFGRRESDMEYMEFGALTQGHQEGAQYGGSLGLSIQMARDWQMRLSGLFDRNASEMRDINPSFTFDMSTNSRLLAGDVAADGSVMNIAGGAVRLAVGGQVRREELYDKHAYYAPTSLQRDIAAVYSELLVPWISEQNRRVGFEHLELTVAARLEDYSDFGSTFNPKLGLAWAPVAGLNLRTTWGTSFKAPLLTQLNPSNRVAGIALDYFNDDVASPIVLQLVGNGERLTAEESTNWTAGFDLNPLSMPNLNLTATYFDIDYDQRISWPFPNGYELAGVLQDPTYAELVVTRNPTPADVAAFIAASRVQFCYSNLTGAECNIADYVGQVSAIVDTRFRNLAGVRVSGIDFSTSYRLSGAMGELGMNLSGTYMLRNEKQVVPGAPLISEVNNVHYPVDLRLRGTVSFSRDRLNATAAVNYVDGYRDAGSRYTGSAVRRSTVSSWTTMDLTLQYELGSRWTGSLLDQMVLSVSAINLFDRDPPYVANAYGFNYDGANATPRGRFLAAQLTARWGS